MTITTRTLGQQASFWVAAAVVTHTLWTSAAPAVTYPLYAAEWHLTPTVTTAIFAVYPVVVVAALLLFGNVSDRIGRRATILFGLAASLLGVLLFAVAPSVGWVFVGRAFMGMGVGLSAGPASAAMLEFSSPGQSDRASAMNTAAQSSGLALATLVGGALVEYAPFPTRLNFWVLFVVLLAIFAAVWFLPRHAQGASSVRWRPGSVSIPKGMGKIFLTSALSVTAAYALGAIMLSLGAQIAKDLIGSSNALVSGAAIALFAASSGTVAIIAKRAAARTNILRGGIVSVAGQALLMLSAAHHSLPLFLAAAVTTGAAYSLQFLGGLTLISANAPASHRAGTLSAIYLIAYLFMGSIALVLGVLATAHGLETAVDIGSPAIALLGIAALLLAVWTSRPRNAVAACAP
ncbi:MFS transporter [Paralcaligenes sp. KSB-10]|jgi:MFS family permease|uniref:MFS transporter n=1 Tax=Paralcaligenes sp. KSB-10 TaxID=2901142 RepID=UPI001E576439|nr:MFS transporter [Paralcaligenes sp. KSB-10]UHL63037.1 MFS transporter [Paralcaligenes sp. KSB-10]